MKKLLAWGGCASLLFLVFSTGESANAQTPQVPASASTSAPQYFAQLDAQLPFKGYLVMFDDGEILFQKNADRSVPIASLTKLMTAQLLIETVRNWDTVISYNKKEHYAYRNYWRLQDGDRVRARDLLYGTLVNSINDPPRMLVKEATPFTEGQFITKMNERAKQLGLRNTRFTDVSGLDSGNVSSPKDIIVLLRETLKDETLRGVLATPEYAFDEVASTDKLVHHAFKHTNRLMRQEDLPFEVLASKTGYIDEAGRTLVMAFQDPVSGRTLFMSAFGGLYADMDLLAFRTLITQTLRLYGQGVRMGQEPSEVLQTIAREKAAQERVAQQRLALQQRRLAEQKKKALQLTAKKKATVKAPVKSKQTLKKVAPKKAVPVKVKKK